MKFLSSLIVAAGLTMAGAAHAAPPGSIFVTEPGVDGFTINTLAFNGSSYDISKLTFDFSSTLTTDGSFLVMDGAPSGIIAPSGGTASFFGGGAVFGFDFTSFGTFDTFSFSWDPDSGINGSYGATSLDFIGAKVTALTSAGTYVGTFELVGSGPDVSAALAPVPEPEGYALMVAGLMAVGAVTRRRSAARQAA